MNKGNQENFFGKPGSKDSGWCLSCGQTKRMTRKRYCSPACRQKLQYHLDVRTGLLRALNTRYATFHFSETMIFMDVLTYGCEDIFSFLYPRSFQRKPVEDFSRMANLLGNLWWREKRKTRKRYMATRQLLEAAERNRSRAGSVRPLEIKKPTLIGNSLLYLKLSREELQSPDLFQVIKTAYRRQAMRHHPDLGGDSANFRKIHEAYQQILKWAQNPAFVIQRGFPDKWFYEGRTNRWNQPTPFPVERNTARGRPRRTGSMKCLYGF